LGCEVDLAWASGLFEGEGSVGTRKTRFNSHGGTDCQVAIEMFDEEPIRKVASIMAVGKVYGPYKRETGYSWKWAAVSKNEILYVYDKLSSYLSMKRKREFNKVLKILENVEARKIVRM
jgi:hypothetical protein